MAAMPCTASSPRADVRLSREVSRGFRCSYTNSPVTRTSTTTLTSDAPAKAPACNGEHAQRPLQCAEKRDEVRSLGVGEDEAEMVFVVDDDVFERLRDAVVEVRRARSESP
jgi:hypothetical protein